MSDLPTPGEVASYNAALADACDAVECFFDSLSTEDEWDIRAIHDAIMECQYEPASKTAMTDQFADGMRRAADIARENFKLSDEEMALGTSWAAHIPEVIADAILAAIPAPAPWTPPDDRPNGYRCLGKCHLGWEEIVWDGEIWRDTCGAPIGADIAVFAPLPPSPDAQP